MLRDYATLMGSGALGGGLQYYQWVKALFGVNSLALYDLAANANDYSGNGLHGTPTNVVFDGIGAQFNGLSSKILLPALTGWNGAEFTIFADAKVSAAADWASVAYNRIWYLGTAAGWQTSAYIDGATANLLDIAHYTGSGTTRIAYIPGAVQTDWFHVALAVSQANNRVRGYINGTLVETGAFTNSLAPEFGAIGVRSSNNSGWWKGSIRRVGIVTREATPAEVFALANPTQTLSIIGDSITAKDFPLKVTENDYAWYVANGRTASTRVLSHAVGGHSIMTNFDADTLTAANDNADLILMQLGTNDDNAGNMTTLQAKVESNIIALKASNPRATLYYMNVLPRWTDTGGGTPVDKSNIRAAIAAACAAQGVTCWDTFTTPWIAANETLDGLHPATAGHAKIAAQIMARLP